MGHVVAVVRDSIGRANCRHRIQSFPCRFVADGVHVNLKPGAVERDGDLCEAFRRPIENALLLAAFLRLQHGRRAGFQDTVEKDFR